MTTKQDKSTALPWEYRKGGSFHIEGEKEARQYGPHIIKRDHDSEGRRTTAFVAVCDSTTLDNEANAELIVRAVNSHEKLLAVAKARIAAAEASVTSNGATADLLREIEVDEQLREAIREAEA